MMEPMTLGSAPGSPSSPGANPNFLPAFLMGETSQQANPNLNVSPGRNRTPGSMRKLGQSNPLESKTMYSKSFNQSVAESPVSTQQFTPHKPGPPNQGLFDTLEHRRKPTTPMNSMEAGGAGINFTETPSFARNISRINDDSLSCSRNFSNFNDTINRSSNYGRTDRIDTHWVTVFGFPPSATSLVLAQLANCGVIVEKKLPSQGNWAHVKFNNLNDVPRALALNGRCINNNIMIGVNLYYNKDDKENESVFTSPIRARSLRQSFISPSSAESVLPPQNVPQKATGIVTKAIEYVFGW